MKDFKAFIWALVRVTVEVVIAACILIAVLLLATGCNFSHRIADSYAGKDPQWLARKCADSFTRKDSIGEPVVVYRDTAHNTDWSGTIDSLGRVIDSLNEDWAGFVNGQDTDVPTPLQAKLDSYRKQIQVLNDRIQLLKSSYKPCEQDSIFVEVPHFFENVARVKEQTLRAEKAEAAAHQWHIKALKQSKVILWLGVALGLVLLLIALSFYFKLTTLKLKS